MGAAETKYQQQPLADIIAPVEDAPISEALVFVSRETVRTVLMRELVNFGIPDVKALDSVAGCLEELKNNPASLLVLDWEQGEEVVAKIMHAAQGLQRVDTRPIYFIALEISERVVSIAHEYNVCQIHTGEISQADISKHLDDIVRFTLMSPLCRQTFHEVADLRREGDRSQVVSKMQDLCYHEPANLRAAVELGFSYCDANRLEEAEVWLGKVAEQFPRDLRTKHLQARCAMRRGQFDDAYQILEAASLISPHNVERLVELGNILLNMDRVKEAMSRFQAALNLDRTYKEARQGTAQCHLLLGEVNEGVKLLGQMENPEELASVFNSAAILSIRHQRFQEGHDLYSAAIGFLSHDNSLVARIFFNIGIGYVKWGKPQKAHAAFGRAVELDPKFEKAKYNQRVLQVRLKKALAEGEIQDSNETEELKKRSGSGKDRASSLIEDWEE